MEKQIKIALAGNPNCGKTTLFNALTGSNQFVGNWPGVTVEKKEGKLKKHEDVVIMDLPGIYSLSPYTLEEVVARNYLIGERPDAILNIIDGTNLERNLYLTTQLTELGIPVVIAINMMDVVRKNGDQINTKELSRELGCPVVEISALKGTGVMEAAEAAVEAAKNGKTIPMHTFSGPVEHTIAHIEEAAVHTMPEEQQRWYAIKIFERDDKVLEKLSIPADVMQHIETDIQAAEKELDDDAESIITNERYVYIAELIKGCYKQKRKGQLSASDKIDQIVTNRWLGLPIFALVMFLVYWIAMVAVGAPATDWANDGLFGDGWHLLGIGSKAYNEVNDEYTASLQAVEAFLGIEIDPEADDFDPSAVTAQMNGFTASSNATATVDVEDEETLAINTMTAYYDAIPEGADKKSTVGVTYVDAVAYLNKNGFDAPDPADYGVWVPGIPVLVEDGLNAIHSPDWLNGLILDGIVGGVGPHAGLDLTRKLFDQTRAEADQEHLPVMLYSFPDRIGERPAFLLGKTADNPGEAIGDIMAELARAGATVIGMPCNTAHSPRILDAALEKLNATGRPVRFVHMIDAVVRHVRQRCGEGARVGILSTLATLETRLYQDSLERAGLEALHPAPDGCARVQEAISNREYGIKARNPVTERARADLLDEARRLAGNADVIILGCTEIPLALPEKELGGVPLIDATDVLARELVRAFAPEKLR